nr:hypothetical protein [uncultured Duganella sp.]
MHIPFIKAKKNPIPSSMSGKETLSKNVESCSDSAGIESIKMEECSMVSGGPQISNRPPA